MPTLYIASRNQHKLVEIQSILGNNWRIASALELDPELDWEETGMTFHANALIKALALRQLTQDPVLADDSGLEVDALGGEPGVYSARFAGPGASDEQNLQKLLQRLQGVPSHERRARFICVLCYLDERGEASYFKGTCEGAISEGSKGASGFGYDPIFVPLGSEKSFAELSANEKNQISHRSQALSALLHFLRQT